MGQIWVMGDSWLTSAPDEAISSFLWTILTAIFISTHSVLVYPLILLVIFSTVSFFRDVFESVDTIVEEMSEVLNVHEVKCFWPTLVCIKISSHLCLSIMQLQPHVIANLDKPIPQIVKKHLELFRNTFFTCASKKK